MNSQAIFDRAARAAFRCPLASVGYRAWEEPRLPTKIRKAGMTIWNEHYAAALPEHLRGTRFLDIRPCWYPHT